MIFTTCLRQVRLTDPARVAMAIMAFLFAYTMSPVVHAKESDRSQTIHINADYFSGIRKPNGVIHLKGHVGITQGSLKITGATAVVHLDNQSSVKRVVLKGSPAHIRQIDDNGNLVKGHANTVDYNVAEAIAKLNGDAYIKQAGRGSASGDTLIYNTTTSMMTAQSHGDSRVHLTFQPRQSASSGKAQPAPATSSGGH